MQPRRIWLCFCVGGRLKQLLDNSFWYLWVLWIFSCCRRDFAVKMIVRALQWHAQK